MRTRSPRKPVHGFGTAVVLAFITLVFVGGPISACPWHASFDLFGEWGPRVDGSWPDDMDLETLARLLEPDAGTPVSIPVDAPAAAVGSWSGPENWPVIAIHTALLPTGKVLAYSYPSGGVGSNAHLWDPATGGFQDVSMNTDIFCSGLSLLDDGQLYATGGNDYACDFQGRTITHRFDPISEAWTELDHMDVGRWYPQNVTLEDGRVVIVSGLGRDCDTTPVMELYDPVTDSLSEVSEGWRYTGLYPRLHLLSDGTIADVGPWQDTYRFTFDSGWSYVDSTQTGSTYDGTTVRVPGSVDELMVIGGRSGDDVRDTAERIDFSDANPQWRETARMNLARAHANTVVLPDRRVLVIGGGTDDLYGSPVYNAEIYDPDAETWTLLPAQFHPRMYHSTAVLLPDGRVVSAGQDSGIGAFTGEIYSPDYLFRGARPQVSSTPAAVPYGQTFEIDTPNASAIDSVAFLRLATVTHSVNNGQQYVGLDFEQTGGQELTAITPQDGNIAPPGYYMLFVVDEDGVPSEAEMVRLEAPPIRLDAPVLRRGETAELVATGAIPGETVRFGISTSSIGPGPCPPAMGGECLDLRPDIIQLGSAPANGSGMAVLQVTIPNSAPLGEVAAQAVSIRGPGGSETAVSNAVVTRVES